MLLSRSAPSPQSWSSHFNGCSGSGSSKSKMSVFDSILHNQGSQACTHQLSLSPVGKITSYLVTFQLCCFGEEMMPAKSSSSLYLLECIQTFLFFYFVLLQLSTGTSLLETWTSTKSLSSVGDCLRQCFSWSPRLWPRRTGAGPWVTAESTARI